MLYLTGALVAVAWLLRTVGTHLVNKAVPPDIRSILQESEVERVIALSLPSPQARRCFASFHVAGLLAFGASGFLLGAAIGTLVGILVHT